MLQSSPHLSLTTYFNKAAQISLKLLYFEFTSTHYECPFNSLTIAVDSNVVWFLLNCRTIMTDHVEHKPIFMADDHYGNAETGLICNSNVWSCGEYKKYGSDIIVKKFDIKIPLRYTELK